MGQQIVTPAGEACFAYVFRPQKNNLDSSKDDQYSLTLLWDKDDPKLKKLKRAIEEAATEMFGEKAARMLQKGQLHSPLRDGDEKEDTKHAELFEGKFFLTAKSSDRPEIVDEDAEPLMQQSDFYAGCIARMDIWIYPYNKKGNKGVACILNSAQKLEEGERKSGRRSAWEAFGKDVDDDEDRPAKKKANGRSNGRLPIRDDDDEDDDADNRPARRSAGRGRTGRRPSILD